MTKEIDGYVKGLPDDRKAAIEKLRAVILENLPDGYEESFSFGMLSYEVPLAVYPDTYNKKPLMYAALASQKSHMALYLCNAYALPAVRAKLEAAFAKAGKKLDMGKSCLRFKRLEDLPLDAVAKAVAATPMKEYVAFAKTLYSKDAKAARKTSRAKSGTKPRPR